jgi:hypothetical protein
VDAKDRPLTSFLISMGRAYLAVTLLASGVGHVVRFRSFRDLVRTHGLVPARLATAVALLTMLAEVGFGAAALVLVAQRPDPGTDVLLFAGPAVLGLLFVGYVRRLLRRPGRATSCGCSPLAGPLTPAALVPGVALALVSATALVAAALAITTAPVAAAATDAPWLLSVLWGATLAIVVLLVPAAVPRGVADWGG